MAIDGAGSNLKKQNGGFVAKERIFDNYDLRKKETGKIKFRPSRAHLVGIGAEREVVQPQKAFNKSGRVNKFSSTATTKFFSGLKKIQRSKPKSKKKRLIDPKFDLS